MGTGTVVVAVLSHRDPPLLERLVGRILEGDDTVVVLHHDPRGKPHGLRPRDRLVLVPDPRPCDWGRMNLARAMLRCLDVSRQAGPDARVGADGLGPGLPGPAPASHGG